MEYISYNTGTRALPDIYALALGHCAPSGVVRIYQAKHSYLCYNFYVEAAEILEPSGGTEYTEEGETITLRYIGVGHPPPLVQWRKLNGSLSDRVSSTNMSMSTNEGNITRVTVDLIITNVSREDTGVYECTVSNLLNIVATTISLTIQCTCVSLVIVSLSLQYTCIIIPIVQSGKIYMAWYAFAFSSSKSKGLISEYLSIRHVKIRGWLDA